MKKISVLAAALLTLAACKRETDTSKPVLELLTILPSVVTDSICGQPNDKVIKLLSGQNLSFGLLLTDNVGLGQYKIDIHDDFDCHGHDGERSPTPTIWSLQDLVEVSGTEQQISRSLQVPADVRAGNYHFELKLIDAEGNENAENNIYTLQIRNSSDTTLPGFLQISSPASSISRGQTLTFSGTAIDNLSLENAQIELSYHSPSDEHATIQTYTYPAGATVEENFSLSYTVPADLGLGLYEFELSLFDAVGNVSKAHFEVEIR